MDEELDLDLEEDREDKINKVEKRITSLTGKIKEKDTLLNQESEARKKAEEERDNISKEREFYKGLNQVSAKYPGASEYQDKILEKVKAGYDVEDATISILAKEGKYTPAAPQPEREVAAGGSASIGINNIGDKSPQEMTQDERAAALRDLEAKGELRL